MDILMISQVAQKLSLSTELIAKYCRQGRFSGAELRGRVWLIPASAVKAFEMEHRAYSRGRPRTAGVRWVLWREGNRLVTPLARADAFAVRAPALLPKGVSRKAADVYAEAGRTETERAARRAMIEALYG